MLLVDAPADARGSEQFVETCALILGKSKGLAERAGIHESHQVEDREPRIERFEHGQEVVVERRIVSRLAVVHFERDAMLVVLAKDGSERGRVRLEVRCHDDDVLGA